MVKHANGDIGKTTLAARAKPGVIPNFGQRLGEREGGRESTNPVEAKAPSADVT